jgi:hypothetical protein
MSMAQPPHFVTGIVTAQSLPPDFSAVASRFIPPPFVTTKSGVEIKKSTFNLEVIKYNIPPASRAVFGLYGCEH